MQSGNDWVVKIGADTTAAEDKVKKLEKKIGGLQRRSSAKKNGKSKLSSEELSLRRQRDLEKKIVDLRRSKRNSEELALRKQRGFEKKTVGPQRKTSGQNTDRSKRDSEELALRRQKDLANKKINTLQKQGVFSKKEAANARRNVRNAKLLSTVQKQSVSYSERITKAQTDGLNAVKKEAEIKEKILSKEKRNRPKRLGATEKKSLLHTAISGANRNRSFSDSAIKGASSVRKESPELKFLVNNLKKADAEVARLQRRLSKVYTKEQFNKLNRELREAQKEASNTARSVNNLTRAMNRQGTAAKSLSASVKHLARSYLSIFAVGAGIGGFFSLGRDMESINAIMLAASGDAQQAARDFDFVIQKSRELGTNLKEGAMGYAKLGAAARGAGLSTAETREIFTGISEATVAFGLNPQRTNLTFLAIQQMLSKGVVSMEELRRQLGEQIPGAFQIAAKAVGMETNELNELVASGTLQSVAFVKALTAELSKSVRESGSLEAALHKVRAEQGRASTELTAAVSGSFDKSSFLFARGFRDLAEILKDLQPLLSVTGKIIGGVFVGLTSALRVITPIAQVFFSAIDSLFTLLLGSRALGSTKGEVVALKEEFSGLAAVVDYVAWGLRLLFSLADDISSMLTHKRGDSFLETTFRTIGSVLVAVGGIFVASRFKWVRSLFGFIGRTVKYVWDTVKKFLAVRGIIKQTAQTAGKAAASPMASFAGGVGSKAAGVAAGGSKMLGMLKFAKFIPLLGSLIYGKESFDAFMEGEIVSGLINLLAAGVSAIPAGGFLASAGIGVGAYALSAVADKTEESSSKISNKTVNVGGITVNGVTDPTAVGNEIERRMLQAEKSSAVALF